MTPRGAGLLLGGLGAGVGGWFAGWPELTALGTAAVLLVLIALLTSSSRARVDVSVDASSLRVVRREPAAIRITVDPRRRRRGLRLVEGPSAAPVRSVIVPRSRAGEVAIGVPVDTSTRGLHPLGPFTVLRGDAWSIVRNEVGGVEQGTLLVRPRTFPVRPGFATAFQAGDAEHSTRRRGEDHFFALRDYTLGDEPRNVHWRSSARSGKLVVRQKVAAAVDGTLLVLDCDESSYGSVEAFGEGFVQERFEAAVEVVASLCVRRADDGQQVHLATTARHQPKLKPGARASAFVDALAVVEAVSPLETNPQELGSLARAARCTHVIVVTGSPNTALLTALRRSASLGPVLVRVGGGSAQGSVPGITTIDLVDATDLA